MKSLSPFPNSRNRKNSLRRAKKAKDEEIRAKLFLLFWAAQYCALFGLAVGFLVLILLAFKII